MNEFYQMIRMGVAGHVRGNGEQRPMNNEYVQIHELANCHAGPSLYSREFRM